MPCTSATVRISTIPSLCHTRPAIRIGSIWSLLGTLVTQQERSTLIGKVTKARRSCSRLEAAKAIGTAIDKPIFLHNFCTGKKTGKISRSNKELASYQYIYVILSYLTN